MRGNMLGMLTQTEEPKTRTKQSHIPQWMDGQFTDAQFGQRWGVSRRTIQKWQAACLKPNGKANVKRSSYRTAGFNIETSVQHAMSLLIKGPRAFGYRTDWWTLLHLWKVLEEYFGALCCREIHLGDLLSSLGLKDTGAAKSDTTGDPLFPGFANSWLRGDWEQIVSEADRYKAHLVFLDYSNALTAQIGSDTESSQQSLWGISAVALEPKSRHVKQFMHLGVCKSSKPPTPQHVAMRLDNLADHFDGTVIFVARQCGVLRSSVVRLMIKADPTKTAIVYLPLWVSDMNPASAIWHKPADGRLADGRPFDLDHWAAQTVCRACGIEASGKRISRK